MDESIWPECLSINDNKTLVIGIGGGYDIYTCLPWYLNLKPSDQDNCIIANYTFTDDIEPYTNPSDPYIASIGADCCRTNKNIDYFPEHHLAQHLNKTIYTFRLIPCPLLIDTVRSFIEKHNIKQIFLFDGGVDSIIFGNEGPVHGSPLEDSQMLLACTINAIILKIPCVLATSALSIDDCDIDCYLKHWEEMSKASGTLGRTKLSNALPFWNIYKHIVQTAEPPSIIQESIIAAGDGRFGNYVNPRLYPCRIDDINDLPIIRDDTSYYWFWNPLMLSEISPFYQHLVKQLESLNKKSPDECWIFWNQTISEFMNLS